MHCEHSVEILFPPSPFSFRFHPSTCGCRVSKLRNFRSRETETLNDVRRKHRYGLETSSCQLPASYRFCLHVPPVVHRLVIWIHSASLGIVTYFQNNLKKKGISFIISSSSKTLSRRYASFIIDKMRVYLCRVALVPSLTLFLCTLIKTEKEEKKQLYFFIQLENTSQVIFMHFTLHLRRFETPRRIRDADPLNQTSAFSLFNPFITTHTLPYLGECISRRIAANRQTVANAKQIFRRSGRKFQVSRIPRFCCFTTSRTAIRKQVRSFSSEAVLICFRNLFFFKATNRMSLVIIVYISRFCCKIALNIMIIVFREFNMQIGRRHSFNYYFLG